jgi:DNA polymerase-3 subunit delta'
MARLPGALPPALLLKGRRGLGKNLLARALAQSALCEATEVLGEACRECAGCKLFEAGTHPDYRELIPEAEEEQGPEEEATPGKKPSQVIRIAAVRELADLAGITAHRGRSRVVVISPAEALHPSAANALLKILEEPPAGMHFLLVSHEPHRLLKTVLSRCFQLAVNAPSEADAVAWLQAQSVAQPLLALALSGYGPFAAAELAGDQKFWSDRKRVFDAFWGEHYDPLVLAAHAEVIEPGTLARLLLMACHDLLAVRHGQAIRYHRDYAKVINRRALKLQADMVAEWVDGVLEFARAAYHPLNRRLALESLFGALQGG